MIIVLALDVKHDLSSDELRLAIEGATESASVAFLNARGDEGRGVASVMQVPGASGLTEDVTPAPAPADPDFL